MLGNKRTSSRTKKDENNKDRSKKINVNQFLKKERILKKLIKIKIQKKI